MLTIKQADQITQDWVEANADLDRARECWRNYPRRREYQKTTLLDYSPEYEWIADPTMGDTSVLVEIRVDEVEPGEGDWEAALQYETTQQYIEWFKQGHEPPPIKVVRHVDGHLVSLNRRRWLAARAAGIETIKAFYSPTLPSGRPAWELKPCTFDRGHICKVYARGGDCCSCDYYQEVKDGG